MTVSKRQTPKGFWDRFPRREVVDTRILAKRAVQQGWIRNKDGRYEPKEIVQESTCSYVLSCGHTVTLIVKGNIERQRIPCPVCGE